MCFQVISMLSRRLKEKWSLRRRQGFHSTLSVLSTLRRHSTPLSTFGIIFTLITHTNREKIKGLTKSSFLVINAKGGESISPKQKDRTTTNFKFFELKFSIGIPLETIFWYSYFKLIYLKEDFSISI
jgi:hypothetical protein